MAENRQDLPVLALALDMDGVLNVPRVCVSMKKEDRGDPFGWIDPIAVNFLNRWAEIIKERGYDPQIFMMSTWRSCFADQTALDMYFSGIGLHWKAHKNHRTRARNHDVKGEIRGDQVRAWMERNPGIPVILIDDDSDFHEDQKENLILTDPLNGILVDHHEHFLEIIDRICPEEK